MHCQNLLTLCLFLVSSAVADDWQYEVTYDQMASGNTLPAGDQFIIVEEAYNTEDACLEIKDDEVAIELITGEFVTMWKQTSLSYFDNTNQYRPLNVMEGSNNPYITIFSLNELVDYRLCFWKDDGDLFNPYRNFYMMVDARERLRPQHLYQFYWVRDD